MNNRARQDVRAFLIGGDRSLTLKPCLRRGESCTVLATQPGAMFVAVIRQSGKRAITGRGLAFGNVRKLRRLKITRSLWTYLRAIAQRANALY
jgi:hypothetical protein